MVSSAGSKRAPWEDRFRRPSADELRSHYTGDHARLIDAARRRLLEFDGVTEQLEWQGLPWRWTLVYRLEGADGERPWAYLIPHRDGPRIAAPITDEFFERLPSTRLSKFVREGLESAKQVADVRWAVWNIDTATHLDHVMDLLKRKHKALLAAT